MAFTTNRPGGPSVFNCYRNVASADSLPIAGGEPRGLNCHGFEKLHVQVKVLGAAPTITVMSWSPAAGEFVPTVPVISAIGPGAAQSFEFTFDCLGRTLFLFASEPCEIWASGVRDRTLI